MTRSKKDILSLIIKLIVIGSCILGISTHSSSINNGFMNSIFVSFTAQSNIWIAFICIVLLVLQFSKVKKIPNWLNTIKFMFTSSILLTWLVFAVLLAPILEPSYIFSPSNIFLHSITPIFALMDFLLFDHPLTSPRKKLWTVTIMPLAYMVFAFITYEITSKLPTYYFFLDYKKFGWLSITNEGLGVGFWILILCAILLLKAKFILKLKNLSIKKPYTITIASVLVAVVVSTISTIISVIIN